MQFNKKYTNIFGMKQKYGKLLKSKNYFQKPIPNFKNY